MWMDDVEMAIDAYRTWMLVKIDVAEEYDRHRGYGEVCIPAIFKEALRAFDIIFKAGEEDGTP